MHANHQGLTMDDKQKDIGSGRSVIHYTLSVP